MADCPRPDKTPYANKAEAIEAWRGVRRGDHQRRQRSTRARRRHATTLTPYRCSCGAWHLGRRRRRMRDA